MHRFNFKSALLASIVATIVMTVWMIIFGMDVMRLIGQVAGMSGAMVYILGGLIHLGVGIFWGLIYAWLFEPWMKKLPGFLSGAIFSLLPFILGIFFLGTFLHVVHDIFAVKQVVSESTHEVAMNEEVNEAEMMTVGCPCPKPPKPCPGPDCPKDRAIGGGYGAPADSRGVQMPERSSAPAPSQGMPMWLWSLINHLIYGVVLGLIYRPRKSE